MTHLDNHRQHGLPAADRTRPLLNSDCTAAPANPNTRWSELLAKASTCADFGRFQQLVRRAKRLESEAGHPDGAVPVKVALLGGASMDLIEEPLRLALQTVGLAPRMYVAPYDTVLHELLVPDSGTAEFEPQITITVLTARNIPSWPSAGSDTATATQLGQAVCRHFYEACSA